MTDQPGTVPLVLNGLQRLNIADARNGLRLWDDPDATSPAAEVLVAEVRHLLAIVDFLIGQGDRRWADLKAWLDERAASIHRDADEIAADENSASGAAGSVRTVAYAIEEVREHMNEIEVQER